MGSVWSIFLFIVTYKGWEGLIVLLDTSCLQAEVGCWYSWPIISNELCQNGIKGITSNVLGMEDKVFFLQIVSYKWGPDIWLSFNVKSFLIKCLKYFLSLFFLFFLTEKSILSSWAILLKKWLSGSSIEIFGSCLFFLCWYLLTIFLHLLISFLFVFIFMMMRCFWVKIKSRTVCKICGWLWFKYFLQHDTDLDPMLRYSCLNGPLKEVWWGVVYDRSSLS